MNNFFNDLGSIIKSFSIVDYILFFSVVILIMLVVSLIYIMYEEKNRPFTFTSKKEEEKEETLNKTKDEELDLLNIIETIDENPKPIIDMTAYEEEQEQKAIISYDELITESKKMNISYDKEELVDDIIPVKKISLTQTPISEIKLTQKEPKLEVSANDTSLKREIKLFSYEKEEAFLKALNELNELLN